MSKPSFTKGEWVWIDTGARSPWHTAVDAEIDLYEQRIGGKQIDHYRIMKNGKFVPRLSFYGESAWADVSRYARDTYGVEFSVFV